MVLDAINFRLTPSPVSTYDQPKSGGFSMFFPIAMDVPPAPPAIIRVADLPMPDHLTREGLFAKKTFLVAGKRGSGIGGGGGINDRELDLIDTLSKPCKKGTGIGGGCGISDSAPDFIDVGEFFKCDPGIGIGCGITDAPAKSDKRSKRGTGIGGGGGINDIQVQPLRLFNPL